MAPLGAFFETGSGTGLRVVELLPGGPSDGERLGIVPGDRIVAINGERLTEPVNPCALLNRHAGAVVRLTVSRGRAADRVMRGAPEERWTKPSAVVMNEGNYSDAHMFPYEYQLFELGPLVGMPVPGTATAVRWETLMGGDLYFGIPQMPLLDQNNRPLESQELQPDIRVDDAPEAAAAGTDQPLQAAVGALLELLAGD